MKTRTLEDGTIIGEAIESESRGLRFGLYDNFLRYTLERFQEPNGKEVNRLMAMNLIFPGGALYLLENFDKIKKEVCTRHFRESEINFGDWMMAGMLDIPFKWSGALALSHIVSSFY